MMVTRKLNKKGLAIYGVIGLILLAICLPICAVGFKIAMTREDNRSYEADAFAQQSEIMTTALREENKELELIAKADIPVLSFMVSSKSCIWVPIWFTLGIIPLCAYLYFSLKLFEVFKSSKIIS